jgi:transcription-repair coupling factor (superfamily II helicase)
MGARDLSIINTPPANRYPIATEHHVFNHELIREAINDEVNRGGQVFFVHNRVQNIMDVTAMIQKLNPNVKITVGHGQMEGAQLEKVMLDFINGDFDVLVATTIIESGLDIPNVNTIIINDAHMYGLSDLHQLRGRVGRSNKKAFCYLLAPPLSVLTDEARKRMKAIVEFSELGSGFNIAMRDLDIRGAGNLLGGEQSGFISEIGYETYQKILDDAIRELKRDEFKEEFAEEIREAPGRDCQVETDMEILIPDDYIESSRERMNIYKELDQAETEESLQKIILEMIDRFGPVPDITQDLFNIARLRQTAKSLRIEKIIFKNGLMICYFPSADNAAFYSSEIFNRILEYVKQHPKICRMKEFKDKLSVTISEVNTVMYGLEQLREMQIPKNDGL